MVSRHDLKIPVSKTSSTNECLTTAISVYLPNTFNDKRTQNIVFALPGGGYTRHYYDIDIPQRENYSLARYLAQDGHIVVTCDHLGVGDSSASALPAGSLDHELSRASANNITVKNVLERLRAGTLIDGVPPLPNLSCIGIGHSMGAGLAVLQQANYRSFDAMALLGHTSPTNLFSTLRTIYRLIRGLSNVRHARENLNKQAEHTGPIPANTRKLYEFFVAKSAPDDVVLADHYLTQKEISRHNNLIPPETSRRKLVQPSAAWKTIKSAGRLIHLMLFRSRLQLQLTQSIDVPIFLGYGDCDVSMSPRHECCSFGSATDITFFLLPDSSHCLNYSNSRILLFQKLSKWIQSVETVPNLADTKIVSTTSGSGSAE